MSKLIEDCWALGAMAGEDPEKLKIAVDVMEKLLIKMKAELEARKRLKA